MIPHPGEIWTFRSPTAPRGELKPKHHLCVGDDGLFLFLGTHYDLEYRKGAEWQERRARTLVIPNDQVPFLPPTESGASAISLSPVLRRMPDAAIAKGNPRGSVTKALMARVLEFVIDNPAVAERERDLVVEGIYGFYGSDIG